MLDDVKKGIRIFFVFILALALGGCTLILQKGRKSDIEKIESLSKQLNELESVKRLLEERLKEEIADRKVKLDMADRGLVITFLTDILFDSGEAKIKSAAYSALDKVSQVLLENVPDMNIGIEGHTDDVPIKYSRWKSNWELSAQRALSVLHYLIDEKGIRGERVSAIGYGEFHPVASNETKDGRQLNRRVEVVILPEVSKVKEETIQSSDVVSELPQEESLNLK